MSAPTED